MAFARSATSWSCFLPAIVLAAVVPSVALAASVAAPAAGLPPGTSRSAAQRALPLVFEENSGQLPQGTLFAGRAQGYSVQVKASSLTFVMSDKQNISRTIGLDFNGAQPASGLGLVEAPYRSNYYVGSDPRNWHTGVRNFDRVALRGLYSGIDLEFYSHTNEIEHDFLLAPGADASRLTMSISGARAARLSSSGDLLLDAEDGYLRLHKPVAYQVKPDGTHEAVSATFRLEPIAGQGSRLSFALGSFDHARTLIIDPVITYATYLAGDKGSIPSGLTADTAGNVYITGTTTSTLANFGVTTTTQYPAAPTKVTTPLAYVAKLASGARGSTIAWLTYYGSATQPVQANVIALPSGVAAPVTVYIGGQTKATDLPQSTTDATLLAPRAGSTFGFVASLASATGVVNTTGYLTASITTNSDVTAVTALSATGAAVTVGGNSTHGVTAQGTTPSTTALPPLGLGIATQQAEIGSGAQQGYVYVLDPTLATYTYMTYLSGTLSGATTLTAAVTSGAKLFVSGYTTDNFPKSGVDATVITVPPTPAPTFWPKPTGTNTSGFAVRITPASQTIDYSYWTGSSVSDRINGLTLIPGGYVVVYGNTGASSDLLTKAAIDATPASPGGTPFTPLDTTAPAGQTASGFYTGIDGTGAIVTTSYLTASTAGSSTSVAGAALDAAGLVYFTGTTNGKKADFPQQTSGDPVVVPLLPKNPIPQDLSPDGATPPSTSRSYLLQMSQMLDKANALAYFGPAAGTSSSVGVAIDSSANLYVLLNDVPSGGGDFTTASAAQTAPLVTDGTTASAYLAQVAFATPGSGPAGITGGPNTYTPQVASYLNSTTYTTETFTWTINGGGTGAASSTVFNLPYSQYLKPYTLSMFTVTLNGSAVTTADKCTVGTSTLTNTQPGLTCVLGPTGASDIYQLTLKDDVTPAVLTAATAATTSVKISAAAFDAQQDSLDLTQIMKIAGPPTLTLGTVTVSSSNVNAFFEKDPTTPNTAVSYTYVLSNTSKFDSPSTHLNTNLSTTDAAHLYPFSESFFLRSDGGTCDFFTTDCDLPPNTTVTYTVTGFYPASDFGTSTSGPFTVAHNDATLTYDVPVFNVGNAPVVTAPNPSVVVNGNAKLTVTLTTSTPTYKSGFELGDTGVSLTATVVNSGYNQASGATVSITLPQGFTETSSSGTGGLCTAAGTTTCTLTNIAGGGNSGTGGSASFTIVGKFNDTGTASDAVAPPATSAAPSGATVASSPVSGQVSLSGSASAATGTYAATPTVTPLSLTVTRVNTLAFQLTAQAPLANNVTNEMNSGDTADQTTYTATLSNAGISVLRGAYFTFPLPVSATGTTATITKLAVTPSSMTINPANQLNCSVGTSTVTCYERDLAAVSSGTPATPASLSYAVSFNASFPETTIPLTTVSGTTTASQAAGMFAAASDTYTAGLPGSANPTTVTVQRSTHVVQSLTFAPNLHPPTGYLDQKDINLDEKTAGNIPGVNDSLIVTASTFNSGVNDAAGVSVNVPLPRYLLIISPLPAMCSINGVATPVYPFNTGAAGVTLTCVPPSSTTPAGTSTGQLAALGSACTTNSGACMTLSFAAKFDDEPTTATIVGNNATAIVSPTAAVATGNNVDTGSGLSSGAPTSFGVQRAAHLQISLSELPQLNAPANFFDKSDINLDEHVAGNAPGKNDSVVFTSTTSNTGKNFALNVSAVNPLPAYLEIFSLPTGCTITGSSTVPTSAQPYTTGASGDSLTCIPPSTAPVSQAAVLQPLGTATCGTSTTSQCLYGTFNAKFVDAPSNATIVGASSKVTVTPAPAMVAGTFSDSDTTSTPTKPANFGVQRAAHLRLASANPTYTDNSALTLDGATPVIGQGAQGSNASTRLPANGSVYNLLRYTVTVFNQGPNYTNTPTLNYFISNVPFTSILSTVGAAAPQTPVVFKTTGSSFGTTFGLAAAQSLPIHTVAYNASQTLELDGYFATGALGTAANSATTSFQTTAFTSLDYQDSDIKATANNDFSPVTPVQVEVVNTPMTNATVGAIAVTPNPTLPTMPQPVSLIFTNVTAPGTTVSAFTTTAPLASADPSGVGILPSGSKILYPPLADNKNHEIYQPGANTRLYNVTSTALVPTVANPTSVCVGGTAPLPDIFVKPERTLLWALQNIPAGTAFNTMPAALTVTPIMGAPATGDITVSVTPSGAAPYANVGPSPTTFPQVPQSQPAQVCGIVNGFTKSTSATQVPVVFAVLEPVNFPPYVVAGAANVSTQTGKGSTSSYTDIYLQVSATQTHDFNDQDPCYVNGSRSSCDDNNYLNAFVFGGGNTLTSAELTGPLFVKNLLAETAATAGSNAFNLSQTTFSSSAQAYVAVVDQATGATVNNPYINKASNPYANQGNFVFGPSVAAAYTVCDPGQATGSYTYTGTPCTGGVTPAGSSQRYIGGGNGYVLGSVGAQTVMATASAGSGLIPLPFPATPYTTQVPVNPPAPSTTNPPVPAIAYITPGQSAGFIWNWLNGVVQPAPATYQLACIPVTSLTDATPVALPKGTTCTISTSNPGSATPLTFSSSPTNYAPTIFITTTGNLFVVHNSPLGRGIAGGITLALCLPLLLFRRRLRQGIVAAVVVLSLTSLPLLTGCGSDKNSAFSSANSTPAGTYYFQVTATSTGNSPANVYSAVFEVVVQSPN